MQIWVDADAAPKVVKEILYRAADRVGVPLTLVANQPLQVPRSRNIRAVQVAAGFDVADNYIVQQAASGDLVVTADIPLAAEVVVVNTTADGFLDWLHGVSGEPDPGIGRPRSDLGEGNPPAGHPAAPDLVCLASIAFPGPTIIL